MATLSGNKIKDTYQSLVKFSDNGNITTSAKQLTDGFGNNSPMYVSTTQVGIGVTPESGLNLHVYGDAKIGSNLTVIGNLVVEGSTTTVGTDTLTVKDPLIVLANNNTSTDAVDIGFYGKYTPSGTTLYSGLFREALTGKYRLFKDLQVEPTTTVNTGGTGYAQATLIAALEGDVTGNITGNVTGNVTGNLTGNVTGNVTGDLTGDVTGDVTGDLTGNVTGGSITATTGLFTDNVNIAGTLVIDDELTVEGSAFGRIEIGGPSGGYIDLKAPHSDDYDLRLITSTGGGELLSIDTLKFYTGATTDLAFTIDASQNATFENNVTIPETPTADTHAASKGYVDAAVEGQDTLAEILANGNTSGANDIIMADNQKIYYGTGSDVEMYFDGATQFGIINDTAGGSIFLRSDSFLFRNDTNQFYSMSTTTHELKSSGTTRLNVNANGITVSGIIKSNTGSASAPAYSFDADGDIGMYRSASDELSFSTAGTKRVSIDSSGETNFLGNINITGNGTIPRLTLANNVGEGGHTYYLTSTDNGIFGIYKGSTDVLTIDGNGDVGIGTDSAQTKLHLQDEDNALFFTLESSNTTTHKNVAIKYQNYSTGSNFWWAGLDGAGSDNASFSFKYNQNFLNEILTLETSGNIGIGTNSPSTRTEIKETTNDIYQLTLYNSHLSTTAKTRIGNWNDDVKISSNYMQSGGTKTQDNTAKSSWVMTIGASGDAFDISRSPAASTTLSSLMKIDSSGNVGIGETSPATKLDVRGTDNGDTVRISNTGTYGGTISFTQGSSDTNIGYIGSLRALEGNASGDNGIGLYSRNRISFYTNSASPDVTISDNGNVGIGTTSPDITGFGWNVLTVVGGTTAGSAGVLELGAPSTDANDQNYGIIAFMGGTGRNAQIAANRDSATNDGRLSFWTSPGAGGIVERMRIDSSGDLYIGGTTDYGGKINIEQGGSANGIVLNNTDSTPPRLYLRDAGGATYSEISANNNLYLNASAIGIGTTSPTAGKLVVVSTEANWTSVLKNYTAGAYGLSIDCSGASSANYVLAAYTPSGTGMFLNGSGNVGITTSPC